MRISAIVLAAGKSSRMGENKLLLPWNGSTVIRHIVDVLACAPVAEVWVVTGFEADLLQSALEGAPCRLAHNPDFESGMASSIATGVRAAPEADGYLIALGDMPFLKSELVLRVVKRAAKDRIVVPRFKDRLGQPILFGAEFRGELLTLHSDKGAKVLLGQYSDRLEFVETDDDRQFEDIDTAEAFEALRAEG